MTIKFISRNKTEQKEQENKIRVRSYIPQTWKSYLHKGKNEGVNLKQLFDIAVRSGLDPCSTVMELGGFDQTQLMHYDVQKHKANLWQTWASPPLIDAEFTPRAWKVDTNLAQLYEIPKFLNHQECKEVISAINKNLVQSGVSDDDYEKSRNSRTCVIKNVDVNLTKRLDEKICRLIGVNPCLSESIEGVRYDPGQFFIKHSDYFVPNTDSYNKHCKIAGQRTWTVMIYLNWVKEGGETVFSDIGRTFSPVVGTALCWNNLYSDGNLNHYTQHESLPVIKGNKYVITKWFRERPGLNDYLI